MENAEPLRIAKTVVIESIDGDIQLPIEQGKRTYFLFSQVLENHLKKMDLYHVYFGMEVIKKIQLKMLEISD